MDVFVLFCCHSARERKGTHVQYYKRRRFDVTRRRVRCKGNKRLIRAFFTNAPFRFKENTVRFGFLAWAGRFTARKTIAAFVAFFTASAGKDTTEATWAAHSSSENCTCPSKRASKVRGPICA